MRIFDSVTAIGPYISGVTRAIDARRNVGVLVRVEILPLPNTNKLQSYLTSDSHTLTSAPVGPICEIHVVSPYCDSVVYLTLAPFYCFCFVLVFNLTTFHAVDRS